MTTRKEKMLLLSYERQYRNTVKVFNSGNQQFAAEMSLSLQNDITNLLASENLSDFGKNLLSAIQTQAYMISDRTGLPIHMRDIAVA